MTMLLFLAGVIAGTCSPEQSSGVARASTSTAIVRGVVVDEPTGDPIAGARVTLSLRAGGSLPSGTQRRQITTRHDGRFEFAALPAGEFVLIAAPGQFRSTHRQSVFGQESESVDRGAPSFELGSGEVKDVRMTLSRSLALEGRVVNEYGEPMADLTVQARAIDSGMPSSVNTTDDRGRFRLYGLGRGTYQVCAESDEQGMTEATGGETVLARYQTACAVEVATVDDADPPLVTIQMRRVGAFTVSGAVVTSAGMPARDARVVLRRVDGGFDARSLQADVTNDRFVVRGVLPGTYVVAAWLGSQTGAASRPHESGTETLVVASDVVGLRITTLPAATLSGRVVRDPRAKGFLPEPLVVQLLPPFDRASVSMSAPASAVVAADGTFTVTGLFGPLVVGFRTLPPGWFVQSVRQGSDDIAGMAREFRGGDASPIEIVLSDRGGSLSVRTIDSGGQFVTDATVLLVSVDPQRRAGFSVPPPSHLRRRAGGYAELSGIRPGEYLVLALRSEESRSLWHTSVSLDTLAQFGRRVPIAEGDSINLDLPLISLRGLR